MKFRHAILFFVAVVLVYYKYTTWLELARERQLAWWFDPRRGGSDFESVFGIELTLDGASSAVSLPDGSLVGLATVQGGEGYVNLMRDWYRICTAENATREEKKVLAASRYPDLDAEEINAVHQAWNTFHESASRPSWDRLNILLGMFDSYSPNLETLYTQTFFAEDKSVRILERVLSNLHQATMQALANVTSFEAADRPYTEIALPGWMFNNILAISDDPPEPPNFTLVLSFDYFPLTRRISVAAHRAGFRRSVMDGPKQIMGHHYKGAHLEGPRPGLAMAIRSAAKGICEMSIAGREYCEVKPYGTCSPRELVAVVDQHFVNGTDWIMLWLQDCGTHGVGFVRWKTWSLSRTGTDYEDDRGRILNEMAVEIAKAAQGLEGSPQNESYEKLSLLLTGGKGLEGPLLSAALEKSQMHDLKVEVVRGEEDQFLAAIGAAEVARYDWFMYNVNQMDSEDFPRWFRRNHESARREI
ncbi:hypothetical protein M409DRAFT_51446 [Zasmidium cellare ATCC 36951]|uniref:Uncharacterized protein n=1 Tax=Zasmidium cellare ATCC 36951 TaxID=1080233 RepID=A0A6A6CTH9_ZASCE|nr:uncharacterized protein M409DRAFT_51446 [Zasmidium cellare ATCC 36951]KAF2170401.1 hypothetical protein M409DRAFT_51446 [Zasmidium cellare ATCC 36951]